MATAKTKDQFANIAFLSATEATANTLIFKQLQLANSLMSEKVALIIHRAEIMMTADASLFNSTADAQEFAITLSDRITDIGDQSQPEVLIYEMVKRLDFGTAASGSLIERPIVKDFNAMPGNGILVPADRIYVGVKGTGLAAVSGVTARIYYTVIGLSTEQYWDLIEARRVMTT